MNIRAYIVALFWVLSSATAGAETKSHGRMNVAATVTPSVTVSARQSVESEIVCGPVHVSSGYVPCRQAIELSGWIRTAASAQRITVSLGTVSASIDGGDELPGSVVTLRCNGQVSDGGACVRWKAPMAGSFAIDVTAEVDASRLPPGATVRVRFEPEVDVE